MIHLDTHVVMWLYAGMRERFSDAARAAIDRYSLCISPMVLLELDYLHESERLRADSPAILQDLSRRIGLRVTDAPFHTATHEARVLSFTRDPFDRMICATAAVDGAPLLTADRQIQAHFPLAFWDAAPATGR